MSKNKKEDSDACPICGAEYKGQETREIGPSREKGKVTLATKCLSCGHDYYFKASENQDD